MDKLKRMSELIEQLNKASMHYYQYAEPILTDFEYDRLYLTEPVPERSP